MVSSILAKQGLVALVWALAGPSRAQGTDVCIRPVTARSGDTCASLAEFAGITVTQFLRSNPFVTSCSALVTGAVYCAEGTASGPPSVPAPTAAPATTTTAAPGPTRSVLPTSPSPTGPLRVSNDGSCGGTVTCAGSRFGLCCSAHGFCGTSDDYCGEGCQVGLGECSTFPGPGITPVEPPETITKPPDGGVLTSTTTVTATIFVTSTVAETTGTATSVVLVTSTTAAQFNTTSTVLRSSTAVTTTTATVRATIIITSTVYQTRNVTASVTQTQTARETATQTTVRTLSTTATSVAISTSTSTAWRTSLTIVTRTVLETSVVTSTRLETLTTVVTSTQVRQVTATTVSTLTSTRYITSTNVAECQPQQPTFVIGTSPTFIIGPPPITRTGGGGGGIITTITQLQPQPTPARPSPIIPGAPSNCKSYDRILSSDNCRQIANRNNISLRDFYRLNPSVSSGSNILGSLLCTPDLLELLLSGLCQLDCDDLWPGYYVCVGT